MTIAFTTRAIFYVCISVDEKIFNKYYTFKYFLFSFLPNFLLKGNF
jgi:hypothetical protein